MTNEKHTATAPISLPAVTLACVDTVNPTLAIKAMQRCMVQINFDRALLFTAQPVSVPEGIEVALISDVHDIQSYSRFIIKGLHAYVETTHVLLMQWDGFVIHPEAWTPLFLDYDYIGATWPATHQQAAKVGNGGFSLRSKNYCGPYKISNLLVFTQRMNILQGRTARP